MTSRNAIYHRHLLQAMKQGIRGAHPAVRDRFAPLLDDIASIYEFDDRIVAPAHGFAGAEDYYARSSAGPLLARITLPVLLVHACDDPWEIGRAHV